MLILNALSGRNRNEAEIPRKYNYKSAMHELFITELVSICDKLLIRKTLYRCTMGGVYRCIIVVITATNIQQTKNENSINAVSILLTTTYNNCEK